MTDELICVATQSASRYRIKCESCSHLFSCHVEVGCHVIDCGCTASTIDVCGLPVSYTGIECVEDVTDYRCGELETEHCDGKLGKLHQCTGEAPHHEFVPSLIHLEQTTWKHRPRLPRVPRDSDGIVIAPIMPGDRLHPPLPPPPGKGI